tara:strand:+ start:599 stop:1036 length:438 start_codon:yes stop_codon:yes gene_type:complete
LQDSRIRKYIRHPSDVPIQVASEWTEYNIDESADDTLSNVGLGGLSFISRSALETGQRVRVCIPILDQENYIVGNVVWCEKSAKGFEIGLKFESSEDVFRLRMVEQICHIEHYRKEVARNEGRELTTQQAASEWISRFASDFPAI